MPKKKRGSGRSWIGDREYARVRAARVARAETDIKKQMKYRGKIDSIPGNKPTGSAWLEFETDTDHDVDTNQEFDLDLIRERIATPSNPQRLSAYELALVVDHWGLDELLTLWEVREKRLASLYDCAYLLSAVQFKRDPGLSPSNPLLLLFDESIVKLSLALPFGIERGFSDHFVPYRLTSDELSKILENWNLDKLELLWNVRENRLDTLYDCARLLSILRFKKGITDSPEESSQLLNSKSIVALEDILPLGTGIVIPSGSQNDSDSAYRGHVRQTIREGQASFRQALISHYGLVCMVTGSTTSQVIEAAHILPYDGKKTNFLENGLLLRADIHRLFDRHLITIDPDTLVIGVCSSVHDSEYRDLDGKALRFTAECRVSKHALLNHKSEAPLR